MITSLLIQEREEARLKVGTLAAVSEVLMRECGDHKKQLREIRDILQAALYPDAKEVQARSTVELAREVAQIVGRVRADHKEGVPC